MPMKPGPDRSIERSSRTGGLKELLAFDRHLSILGFKWSTALLVAFGLAKLGTGTELFLALAAKGVEEN